MQKPKIYLLSSGVIFLLVVLVTLMFVSRGAAKHFVLNGVYFDGQSLVDLSYEEAGDFIDDTYVDLLDEVVWIEIDGQRRKSSLRDLGVSFDTRRTLQSVKDYSYGNNLLVHLQTRLTALSGGKVKVNPVFEFDYGQFEMEMHDLFPEIKPAREAQVKVVDGKVIVEPHVRGLAVEMENAYNQLLSEIEKMEIEVINPRVKVVEVSYTTNDAEADAKIWEWFLAKEVKLINPQNDFDYNLAFQPEWLMIRRGETLFDRNEMGNYLERVVAPQIDIYKMDMKIVGLPEAGVGHVQLEGEIRDGRIVHIAKTVENMVNAFNDDRFVVPLEVVETRGGIVNGTEVEMADFQLLSQGRSNFKGSTAERAFNVNKGLVEKMNNIIIPPGETFDFNSFLGPVTYAAGWKEALAIFNGKDLESVAGGGLCQVSTTVYRAALNAGFEVVEQRNHSLYVHYYKDYGNGLDATIYPGQQNLKFVNNSGNYVLMRSWTDGDDAYVNFYGKADGRSVELIGPLYSNTVPEVYRNQVILGANQIAWIQRITWPNGEVTERILKSSYKNSIMR